MNLADYRLPALRVLVWAVWAEFLLVRVFSRVGIYIPKGGAALTVYQGALTVGEVAFNLSLLVGVLVLAATLRGWGSLIAALAAGMALFAPGAAASLAWSLVTSVVLAAAVTVMGSQALSGAKDRWEKAAIALALAVHVLVYAVGGAQLAWAQFDRAGELPGAGWLLRAGELVAMVAPVALAVRLWVARHKDVRVAQAGVGVAAAGALGFAYWVNADITAVLAMYSLGFSMSWPVAVYLAALVLGVPALLQLVRERPERGLALAVLFLAGYSLHMNQQHILVLAGWALLSRRPVAHKEAAAA